MGEVLLRLALLRQGVLTREQLVALELELQERAAARSAQRDAQKRVERSQKRPEGA